jgi:hypothetical protein
MEYQDGEEIPDKFEISMMASTIATSVPRQDDYDVDRHRNDRRIHKIAEQEDARQAMDQLAIRDDLGAKLNQHIQGYSQTIYQCNSVYRQQPGRRSFKRPTPDPAKQQRWKFDWSILCKACGRVGHDAAHCHSLAMGILLQKYMSDKTNESSIRAASEAWHEKNTNALRPPGATRDNGRTPLQAVANMVENYWIQVDQIDDELDWHYFETNPQDADEATATEETTLKEE